MDKEKLARLKELAEYATPGPWKLQYAGLCARWLVNMEGDHVIDGMVNPREGGFIAAANPATILDLIAEIERLEKEAAWLAGLVAEQCKGEISVERIREAAKMLSRDKISWWDQMVALDKSGKVKGSLTIRALVTNDNEVHLFVDAHEMPEDMARKSCQYVLEKLYEKGTAQ